MVWDAGILEGRRIVFAVKRGEYYRQMRVEVTTPYTVTQLYAQNAEHRTFGPWESSYQALTRQGLTRPLPRYGRARRRRQSHR